jgi:hypothetical protein
MRRSDKTLALCAGVIGSLSALWNISTLFRPWVVSSQAEAKGATTMFVFAGIAPVFGIAASLLRKRWGAWILTISPIFASVGLGFLKGLSMQGVLFVAGIYLVPPFLVGLLFLRLNPKSSNV